MGLFLKILGISLAILFCLFVFLVFTEPLLLLGLAVFPFTVMRWKNLGLTLVAAIFSVTALVLHLNGYKLFGSAVVAHTPPLLNTRTLIGLDPPNLLRFAGGETAILSGISIPLAVDLSIRPDQEIPTSDDLRILMLLRALGYQNGKFQIDVQTDSLGRAITQRRQHYWCGNTFFPTFLPARLPSHKTVDLGETLVQSGLAIPSESPGPNRAHHQKLLHCLSTPQDSSYYFTSARIPRHDATTGALGRSLATPDSRYFVAGAFLLVAAQDTESYPAIRREIQRRKKINRDDYNEIAQMRSEDFDTLLNWMDAGLARRNLLPISFANGSYGPTWPESAMILACHGDLQGFDAAMQQLPASSGDRRRALEANLKSFFRWPQQTPFFSEWYLSVRPKLKSGRDQHGQLAFWMAGGQPFDSDYFATMPKAAADVP